MVVHTCDPSTWKVEARRFWVQALPLLLKEGKAEDRPQKVAVCGSRKVEI